MLTCRELLAELPEVWQAATRHPFLTAVAEGSTPAFARWLPQDVLFVGDLIAFQARLVAKAPRTVQLVLTEGVVGLIRELDWFDEVSAELGIGLEAAPEPVTLAYRELLDRLDRGPATVSVVGLWVLERVYLDAWRHAAERRTDPRFDRAIEHWTDPGFATYVDSLESAADTALADPSLSAEDVDAIREVVRQVLAHEIAFWDMSCGQAA